MNNEIMEEIVNEYDPDIEKTILTNGQIIRMVERLAIQLSDDYEGKNPLLVVVLKGSMIFASDLLQRLSINCEIDFMVVSSYVGTQSTGSINVIQDLRTDIAGRDVLIIEDIIDSGVTLASLKQLLERRAPRSVKICTLLDKPSGRKVPITADYVGGTVGDEFIVGYGLDYNEKYRNISWIGVLKESVYSHN